MKIVVDKHLPFVENAFGMFGDLHPVETADLTGGSVRDADILIVRSPTTIDRNLLEGSSVRFVGTATIGTDHVDLAYLASRGIAFASAPGSNSNSVKEYVVSALLHLSRAKGFTLKGRSIGIVGVGHVGSKVRQAAETLGMRVFLNDPPLGRKTGDSRYLPLDALMEADVLTLHVPLTKTGPDATFHLFDDGRFDRIKEETVIINTSRGAVVRSSSLMAALRQKRIRWSVLDVWEHEPAIDAGLLTEVTLGTPHIAGYSLEGKTNAVRMMHEAICGHLGVSPSWDPETEFARLGGETVDIAGGRTSEEELLHTLVAKSYDVALDDTMLRKMLDRPEPARAGYFKELRSSYRTRREFSHTTVRLPRELASMQPAIASLGFSCILAGDRPPDGIRRGGLPTTKEITQ